MQFQVQGSSKNKVTNAVMPSTLFWLQCMHDMWVTAGKYQTCSQHHWHCSICPTMASRFIFYCKGNQHQEVTDSCWHLLQTAYQSGASKGMSPKRWKSLVPIPPWTCDWLGHYGRLWTMFLLVLILCSVIMNLLDSFRSVWLASDLKHLLMWRNLSPPE
jgi:hypothetical protein